MIWTPFRKPWLARRHQVAGVASLTSPSFTAWVDVAGIVCGNSRIYVTLWSLVGGQWYYNEYNYTSGP